MPSPFNDIKVSPLPTVEELQSKSRQFTNQLLQGWQQNAAAKNKAEAAKGNKGVQPTNENENNQKSSTNTGDNMDNRYNTLLQNATESVRRDIDNSDIVNILKDYDWVTNKNTNDYRLIPAAYVREFRQNVSTFAMSLIWFFSGPGASVLGTIGDFSKYFDGLTNNNVSKFISDFINKIKANIPENVSNLANKIKAKIPENIPNTNLFNQITKNYPDLLPYQMMYSFDKTDCLNYVFPYFDDDFISFNTNFSDNPQVGNDVYQIVSKGFDQLTMFGTYFQQLGSITDLIDSENNTLALSNYGIYLEKPKYFQYGYEQDSANIKFILYNTVNHGTILDKPVWQKNYRFIKSFVLKNLPYKLNSFKYKTPALYEVSIPGVKYFPVSFVAKMSVKGLGTRRYLSYDNNQKVLVPDAWEINIDFRSLFYKSANLYAVALEKGPIIIDPAQK